MKPARTKSPTQTHLVSEVLRKADDFLTRQQIAAADPGIVPTSLSVTFQWLKKSRVIDAIEVEGRLHWFYLGEDARCRHHEEMALKDGKIRRHKSKLERELEASLEARTQKAADLIWRSMRACAVPDANEHIGMKGLES